MEVNASNATFERNSSTTDSIGFMLPEGVYSFIVENLTLLSVDYSPAPAVGCLPVLGVPVHIDVKYTAIPLYVLSFHETGLPLDFGWNVNVVGGHSERWSIGSDNASADFLVPAGTYEYSVQNVTNSQTYYRPLVAAGSVSVAKDPLVVDVTFVQSPAYSLDFSESGLPTGTYWSVSTWLPSGESLGLSAPTPELGFSVPNGSYRYTIPDAFLGDARYAPTPQNGVALVDGAPSSVDVKFVWIPTFNATFVETGLPAGAVWVAAVTLGAIGNLSVSGEYIGDSEVIDLLPDGSYNFTVWGPSAYTASPAAGSFVLDGASVTIAIEFSG